MNIKANAICDGLTLITCYGINHFKMELSSVLLSPIFPNLMVWSLFSQIQQNPGPDCRKVGKSLESRWISKYLKNHFFFRFLLSVYLFQYQAKSRTSASEGMRHAFFNSLGPSVHRLPDSKYRQLFMKITESRPQILNSDIIWVATLESL